MLASIGLHAFAVAAFLFVPNDRHVEAQAPESVLVEVVTPQEFEDARNQERPEKPEPELDEQLNIDLDESKTAEEQPHAERQQATLQPRQPTSQARSNPQTEGQSEEPREIIPGTPEGDINAPPIPGKLVAIPRARVAPKVEALSGDKLREQLCHEEAIARIAASRNDLKPDLVVSSAIDEAVTANQIILANGAAFRSSNRWYQLKFRCEAKTEDRSIVAFDFLVGPAFPQEELEVRPATTAN
ncbi:MAG: DUF930 domain-containing protein [Hyphomicrobiales bacterium]